MLSVAEQTLARHGPLALAVVFILVALDSSAFLGLVLPAETIVLLTGALAGIHALSPWPALATVIAAAITGDLAGYALGRSRGRALLARWRFARRSYESHRATMERYFQSYGALTVLVGRLVAVGRAFVPFSAGLYRMRARTFIPMAVFSGAVWGSVLLALGFIVGQNWPVVERGLRALGAGLMVLVGLALLMASLWRYLARHEDRIRMAGRRFVDPLYDLYGKRLDTFFAFMRARLSPASYLGLHLTVGFVVTGSLAWLFGGIVQDIFAQDPLVQVDQIVALFVVQQHTPTVDSVMRVAAIFGQPQILAALISVSALALFLKGDKALAVIAGCALGGAYGLAVAVREALENVAPAAPANLVVHGFARFPSITLAAATAAYGVLWYTATMNTESWRWQTLETVIFVYLLIVIGAEAVYRGEPLSAALGGFALGGCWLGVCLTGNIIWRGLRKA